VEGEKVWQAAQRQGCRSLGEIDVVNIIFGDEKDALCFKKPELAIDLKANTYVARGTPERKPISEVLQDMISNLDLSKYKKDKDENDLGEDLGNVDFANPTPSAPPTANEEPKVEPDQAN
jgi:nascent polypeptide-associated complex subunit beta